MSAPEASGARELQELAPGQGGRISEGPAAGGAARRLRELGLVPGTPVRVVRRGALGDPVELELRGFRVCVRRADLEGLRVLPEPA